MVAPRSFISPQTASRIKGLIRRGSATAQALMDPVTIVTFTRDGTTAVASDVELISIALDDRDQTVSGQAAIEEATTGTVEAWADDVDAVRKNDRFRWDSRLCEVTSPPAPEQYGTITMRFRVLGGKP